MPDEELARIERERLFGIIEDLVIWENSNNEEVLDKAKMEIARSVARSLNVDVPIGKEAVREFLATKAPPVLDPFAGGGSIPLEAQRLGLRAYASDLNPVAVLINKALIEIPPKFANMPPIHPVEDASAKKGKGKKSGETMPLWQKEWKGAQGLAEDVRHYGKWMRDEAFKRIGNLYPPVIVTKEMLADRPDLKVQGLKIGDQLTVLAWLWARTVKCPNPACGTQMPLVGSFSVWAKKKKEVWILPKINKKSTPNKIDFQIKFGAGNIPNGTVSKAGAHCIACDAPVALSYIRDEGIIPEKRGDVANHLIN
jgi:putative DNA methylase